MSTQHPFYESPQKLLAREENVRLFRELTGLQTIPPDRQYWTLAAEQRDTETSEINQMLALGLITSKAQFFGTDTFKSSIEKNKLVHPEATWIHGQWEDVIAAYEPFNPGLLYLDTENLAGRITLNMAASTMKLCPVGSVLLLNVMQSSRWRTPLGTAEFIDELSDRVPNLDAWVPASGVQMFDYASCNTLMRTYAFHRSK